VRRTLLVLAIAAASQACSPKPIPDAGGPGSGPFAFSPGSAAPANLFSPENRPRAPAKPLPPSPSSTLLSAVAVTDEGDAAISADDLGDIRLWPSLDGHREPVPIRGAHPIDLALGHVGDDLIAPALDAAGIVTLLRFSRDGGMIARTQLPGEVRVLQAVVAGELVLVRRADQTIDAFDASGAPRGRIAPPPGEQIGQLVTRHGAAIAVTGGDNGFRSVRWIDLRPTDATGIAWGKSVDLPAPVDRIALSPKLDRIGAVSAIDASVTVYAADTLKVVGTLDGVNAGGATFALGFVDDDHLAIDRGQLQWWVAPATAAGSGSGTAAGSSSGPVTINDVPQVQFERPGRMSFQSDGSIGDGVMVSTTNTALAVTTATTTRWLGYKDLPSGLLTTVGDVFATTPDSRRMLWLDSDLRVIRSWDPPSPPGGHWMMQPVAVGDHRVAYAVMSEDDTSIEVADVTTHATTTIATGLSGKTNGLIEAFGDVLAVRTNDGASMMRFQVDAAGKATPLAPLAVPSGVIIKLVDPAQNDGIVAYASLARDDGYHVASFRESAAGATAAIQPTVAKETHGYVFAFDAVGHSFSFTGTGVEERDRTGAVVQMVPATGISNVGAVSRDGSAMAFIGNHEVVMLGSKGEQWRLSVWQPTSVTFMPDGSRVAIGTPTGFVIADARTGKRVDARCGWSFGLWDAQPATRVFGQAPVCEE
jgi:hypothetical protein